MTIRARWAGAAGVILFGGLFAGCHHASSGSSGPVPAPGMTPAPTPSPMIDATPSAVPKGAPSDAEIGAILLAANYTDISYAKLVTPSRTNVPAIRDFAKQMLTDHSAVNKQALDLFATININPEDNPTSLDFRDESEAKRDLMRDLEGRAFDSTYIANEISYHTKLLDALDRVLIPGSRNLQLKQFLANIRPVVAAHLGHAQDIKSNLGIGGQ